MANITTWLFFGATFISGIATGWFLHKRQTTLENDAEIEKKIRETMIADEKPKRKNKEKKFSEELTEEIQKVEEKEIKQEVKDGLEPSQ